MNHPKLPFTDPYPSWPAPADSCTSMISLFACGPGVRLSIVVYRGGGVQAALDPTIEIGNAVEEYWGANGGDNKDDWLEYLGGKVTVTIKEQTDYKVVAEVDSKCGRYFGIAVLTRKVGAVDVGELTDWEDGPP